MGHIDDNLNFQKEADISEDIIREKLPTVLEILLIDRTKSTPKRIKNIIWANNNYLKYGAKYYQATQPIKPELVSGQMSHVIIPRSLKTDDVKKARTKAKAEVFTPTWIVKKQNDAVDKDYLNDDLETYVSRTWLEITCGEAPYMTTRYDMNEGKFIPIDQRVGFVDRKLARVNAEVEDKAEWQRLVEAAYQSSYGFEWNGDSLLLARENLLYTYYDFYRGKWHVEPSVGLLENISNIISYNVFQMDGLNYTIPLTEHEEIVDKEFDIFSNHFETQVVKKRGKRVKIMNWKTNRMEFFDKGIK